VARRALLVIAAMCAAPRGARADGAVLGPVSPRAVGRAGAAVVSDDGAGALVLNPAALARREAARVQLGVVVIDDDAHFDAVGEGPIAIERGPSTVVPVGGGAMRLGPLVVGAALLDDAVLARAFPEPEPGQPVDDVERLFPHRYAGLALSHRRRTLAVGASWRATEWLAIGASLTASRESLAETRRVWAGFTGRDMVASAERDITVRVDGTDAFVPGGAVGVLAAPADVPIELGVSASYADAARIDGGVAASVARPGMPPTVELASPRAQITLRAPLIVRTGARWLAERWILELAGELALFPSDGASDCRPCSDWTIDGVTVVDDTGARGAVDTLRSRFVRRAHGAVRVAADVELVPGFLWGTAGYAYQSAATPRDRSSASGADLGGHTAAVGVEIATDGATITLGVARTFTPGVAVDVTRLTLDNPFAAGTTSTGQGTSSFTRDVVALTAELEVF
jgi:hypothetical protein